MPTASERLGTHEQVLLLMLNGVDGTMRDTTQGSFALGAAVLGELADAGRVELVPQTRRLFVELRSASRLGDPVLDDCLEHVRTSLRLSVEAWIARLAEQPRLVHRVAGRLVARGILRLEERTVLLLFKKRVYPLVDPRPARALRERLWGAIASEEGEVDRRTMRLLSLVDSVNLLPSLFGPDDLKGRSRRIRTLVGDEPLGAATRRILAATADAMATTTKAAMAT